MALLPLGRNHLDGEGKFLTAFFQADLRDDKEGVQVFPK
jgi:hypothetical protein